MKLTVGLVCLCSVFTRTSALSCLPCPVESPDKCENSKKLEDCPYGLERDPCFCCYVCAKAPGERCGGPFIILGKCGRGLICSPNPDQAELGEFAEGVCRRKRSRGPTRFRPVAFPLG